ncbi:MAG: hypothetical protein EBS00_07965, partial [Verrucomicrobia bacterium]|nr:hypothetical protein [Verrucomicrobiota bacterium]
CLSRATLLGAAVLISAASPIAANAANGTWGGDASGAWSTASLWSGSVIPGATTTNSNTTSSAAFSATATNSDVATFNTTLTAGRTITGAVGGSRILSGITFNHSDNFAYSLSQGALFLSNGGTVQQISSSGTKTDGLSFLGGIFLQSDSATSTGSYTFDASGNSTSLLSIGGGTIRGTASTGKAYTLNLTGSNTGANAITYQLNDGFNGGVLNLVKAGTGKWQITSTAAATGTVTINAGTLETTASNVLSTFSDIAFANTSGANLTLTTFGQEIKSISGGGSTGGNISLGSLVLTITGTNDTTYGGVISGATGQLVKKAGSSGTLTLTGTNTFTGAVTINAGTISVGTIGNQNANGNLGAGTNFVLAGGTLKYTGSSASTTRTFSQSTSTNSTIEVTDSNATLEISGVSSGSGNLTKTGAGKLTLSANNT